MTSPSMAENLKAAEARICELDFTATRERLTGRSGDPWLRHMANEIELEYRRLLLLHLITGLATIRVGPVLTQFWLAHSVDPRYRADVRKALSRRLDPPDRPAVGAELQAVRRLFHQSFGRPLPDSWVASGVDGMLGLTS
jgi:hypothetical protein